MLEDQYRSVRREALGVMAAVAVVLAIVAMKGSDERRHRVTTGRILTIATALDSYAIDFERYPEIGNLRPTEGAVDARRTKGYVQGVLWAEPLSWPIRPDQTVRALYGVLVPKYLVEVPSVDGWGQPLLCAIAAGGTGYTILSTGRDGLIDGSNERSWDSSEAWRDVIYRNNVGFASAPEGFTH